ncbi:hypothetical protein JCGZ_21623 [Jatropha curcas]|uniref:Seipin n=1 Tax=Jatropha curcas TaxID=180498 RepID=A0A067JBK4_JATCU|nr:seipin-2 [Jatropha curcas]KDP21152.1 hypothetical protein JCGZ_21623 [Jatropha curcas]
MEPSNETDKSNQDEEDSFFDALEDFPFHDCAIAEESEQSISDSILSESSPEIPNPATTLRRRSTSHRGISGTESKDSNSESSCISSDITQNDAKTRYKEKRYKLYRDLKENEKNLDVIESTRWNGDRVDLVGVTSKVDEDENDDQKMESKASVPVGNLVDEADELGDPSAENLLEFVVGMLIKAVGFQVNLFVSFITFPIWALYSSYMLVVDPFGVMRRGRGFLMHKLVCLWNSISGLLSPLMVDWLKEQKSIWKLVLRFGLGIFWSSYVCIILFGYLVFSIMISGFLVRYLVENPIEIKNELYFDYTESRPVAFVPIMACGGVGCGGDCEEKSLGPRVIPPNHKLQANVLLTLPESAYNRNLGIFQVRVDFLSADGKTLASRRQPCMLKFKSETLHVLLTFFKLGPLITGYLSESQTLKVKNKGFVEGDVPTSCLKVIIEQRAEYRPGAGIPEIYDASLVLESELPLFKRIIWCWKKTIFVWISIVVFIIELLFTLICCRPVIIPRSRPRNVPAVYDSTPNRLQRLS